MKHSGYLIAATLVATTPNLVSAANISDTQIGELRCTTQQQAEDLQHLHAILSCAFSPFDEGMDQRGFVAELRISGEHATDIDVLRFTVRAPETVAAAKDLTGAYTFAGGGDDGALNQLGGGVTLTPAVISAHQFSTIEDTPLAAARLTLSSAPEASGAG